jgi:cellulose biosynthesis protein BcsE
LGIEQLQDEHMSLRQGGIYWVLCDLTSDAVTLTRQTLAALRPKDHASLIGFGFDVQEVVSALPDHNGPARLRLFSVAQADTYAAFKSLTRDLHRARTPAGSVLVLLLPSASLDSVKPAYLQRWCNDTRDWLRKGGATLLVVGHGPAPHLHDALLALNEHVSGLAQLYRRDSGIFYQLNFWHSALGVCGSQAFELEVAAKGLAFSASERLQPIAPRTDDQRIYLTQRAALEGAAPLSDQWRVFERRDDLLQQAAQARAATVVLAIDSNRDVESLGHQLHALRERCGVFVKIVVREIEPCLRYRDERLLLACGANLIVPFKTQLAHFLSLVDSIQGQAWRYRQAPNIDALLDRLRPPPQRGLLSPSDFIILLEQVYGGASGELAHQLLKLRPHGDLPLRQYMKQITLRRFGDVACVLDGNFYLFLFACRGDGLEPALGNICRLPWRDIFSACTALSSVDVLARQDFLAATQHSGLSWLAVDQVTADLDAAINQTCRSPQRIVLSLSEPCP